MCSTLLTVCVVRIIAYRATQSEFPYDVRNRTDEKLIRGYFAVVPLTNRERGNLARLGFSMGYS